MISQFLKETFNPEKSAEMHLALSKKYLREGEELLNKGDYVQASEKGWEAASQMVKALTAKRGIELRSHSELHKFVSDLSKEKKNREIITLWLSASSLHQNFYENWLTEEAVKTGMENVKKFTDSLLASLSGD